MRGFSILNEFDSAPTSSVGSSRPIHVTLDDEREFAGAVADYRVQSGRQFPTCSELLEVLKSLGYDKRIWKPVEVWSDPDE